MVNMSPLSVAAYFVVLIFVGIYLGMSGAMFITGLANTSDELCVSRWRRVEYVLPAFRVGCWAGKEVK